MPPRTAVFIDGENFSHSRATELNAVCDAIGPATLKRVYGDLSRIPGWLAVPGLRAMHAGNCGKNSADILIAIEATEYSFSDPGVTFVLVSSDRDFTHLALRLRERGHPVIGVGEEKTSESYRRVCSEFRQLYPRSTEVEPTPPVKPQLSAKEFPELTGTQIDRAIRGVIASNSKEGRGMPLVKMATELRTRHGVTISQIGKPNWRSYLSGHPDLYSLDPKGPDAHVRFKPAGFANLPL